MMVDLYQNSGDPLSHNTMFAWHGMLMSGDVSDLAAGPAAFVREFICDECGWLWPQSEQVRTGLGSRSSALRILHLGSSKFGACGPELVWI
jgi:hypothetical protein